MELAYYRAAGDEHAFPPESVTGFQIKSIGNWTVLQIMSGDLLYRLLASNSPVFKRCFDEKLKRGF